MMTSDLIGFSVDAGVCTLSLRNASRRNAMNAAMRKLLVEYLAQIEARDDIRSVLLVGEGPIFCAGQDLDEDVMHGDGINPAPIGRLLHEQYHPVYRAFYRLTKPSVCAVNGAAIGGGATLAASCDFAFAGRSAKFSFPYVKLGLGLDAAASFVLVRRVGVTRAAALAMFGDPINAETAEQWGLIWKCVDDSELPTVARQAALQLAKGAPSALAGVKAALASAALNNFDQQLDYERDLQRWLCMMPDYKIGLKAFKEKRPPQFGGGHSPE